MVLYAGISDLEGEGMAKIKVLEVDQWTSTGNVTKFTFADFDLGQVTGKDSQAIRELGLASARILEVEESDEPGMGDVWFREGQSGKLELWKANYDSSG